MIEKSIQDILNASIGLFKAGEDNLQSALSAVQTAFEDLKTKGASDQSEVAGKLREVLDNSIKGVQDVSTQVEDNMNKILEEARKSYDQIIEQAKQVIGDERIQDVNDRFEDLASFVKEKSDEMNSMANNFAETVKSKASELVDSAKDVTGKGSGPSAGGASTSGTTV